MAKVCRLGDMGSGTCTAHETPISVNGYVTTCSGNVNAEGAGVATVGDTVTATCGHTGTLITGASRTNANGRAISRVGDSFSGSFSGTMVTGALTVDVE
jgi:uncharacterized Zn-binding protein involved in type VI secretion